MKISSFRVHQTVILSDGRSHNSGRKGFNFFTAELDGGLLVVDGGILIPLNNICQMEREHESLLIKNTEKSGATPSPEKPPSSDSRVRSSKQVHPGPGKA